MELHLLDSFELRCVGDSVPLPLSAQRLLAFLALQERPVLRVHAAAMLWLDAPEERAYANLRSALWRLRRPGLVVVEASSRQLGLAPGVRIDLRDSDSLARRVLAGEAVGEVVAENWPLLASGLLPEWYDDWVLVERERHRQLGLHALEVLCETLVAAGRLPQALEVALAAVGGEPLRESAHRALMKVHLAEGNHSEVVRQYDRYRELVHERLGLDPSLQMELLVEGLTAR
jgi:DNA-binding SARP family transcriptional activator